MAGCSRPLDFVCVCAGHDGVRSDPCRRSRAAGQCCGLPCFTGGMPPAPQAAQLAGQKQSQQQYDPSTGPPVQNAASLHTPPPQLPGRLAAAGLPATALPAALQFPQPPLTAEPQAKAPLPTVPAPAPPAGQHPAPTQPAPLALHMPTPGKAQMQAPPLPCPPQVRSSRSGPLGSLWPSWQPLPRTSGCSVVSWALPCACRSVIRKQCSSCCCSGWS